MPVWQPKAGGRLLMLSGGLLGAGLILYGVWRYSAGPVDTTARIAAPSQPVSQVVTAARPLVRGQLVAAADLKSTPILGAPPPGALTAPAQAAGKIAVVDIQAQQLILNSLISADAGAAGLAMLVPAGLRAISIDTTDDIAVGGFVRPGDVVDVEIVLPEDVVAGAASGPNRGESRMLLQNIRVLTVGPTLGQPSDKDADGKERARARALTLVMTPPQIAPFMLARKLGQFYLLLRNPQDRSVVADGRAVLASLRGGAAPPAMPRLITPVAARVRSTAPRAIELIVGGRRQLIYPSASAQ